MLLKVESDMFLGNYMETVDFCGCSLPEIQAEINRIMQDWTPALNICGVWVCRNDFHVVDDLEDYVIRRSGLFQKLSVSITAEDHRREELEEWTRTDESGTEVLVILVTITTTDIDGDNHTHIYGQNYVKNQETTEE